MLERLRAEADPSGFVAFDRCMELALYAPGLGFYARPESPLGPRGHFYTASQVSPLFARTLASHLADTLRVLPSGGPLRVVELGPGDGTLGAELLRSLAGLGSTKGRLTYTIVERSEPLRRTALERLEAGARELGVRVDSAGSVSSIGGFRGAVVANELLDALPARRLRRTAAGWDELGLRLGPHGWTPAARPLDLPPPGPVLPASTSVGTVLELSSQAEATVREVADHLIEGTFVVIDYGMDEEELLAGHPEGTLAAVRDHRPVRDPLEAPGSSDLSVFVNFTRIRAMARSAGLTEVAYRSQAEALGSWGFEAMLEQALRAATSPEEGVRIRLAAKNLLFGFERFRVLELAAPGPGRPSGER